MLASPRLSVALKLNVIKTRIVPIMSFAMEVWSPKRQCQAPALLAPFKAVYDKACRLACGLHRTRASKAWTKRRSVAPEVMEADLDIVPLHIYMSLAHALFMERMEALNRLSSVQAAAHADLPDVYIPRRTFACDHMGSLLRSALPASDSWKTQCNYIPTEAGRCDRHGVQAEHQNYKTRLKEQARQVAAHARALQAAPLHCGRPTHSLRGRPLTYNTPLPEQLNPVGLVVGATDTSGGHPFLRSPSKFVWPVLALRSAHLPGDYSAMAQHRYRHQMCVDCGSQCVRPSEDLHALERNWRHIQHTMFMCEQRRCGPTMHMLHHDLSALAAEAENDELAQLVHTCFQTRSQDWQTVRRTAIDFFMDPSAACKQAGSTSQTAKRVQQVCSAYCQGVGAAVSGEILEDFPAIMRCLPQNSQVGMALAKLICSGPDNEPDSDCEVWMDSDAESDTDTVDLLLGFPARIRDTLETDVPRGPPEPGTITSVSLPAEASLERSDLCQPPPQRLCCSVSICGNMPHTSAMAHGAPFKQPPSVRGRTDMLSDSEDELPFDGLAYVVCSQPRVSSLPHPPPKRHCPADRSTHYPALHSVPAPASVPSPSGLRGRCPPG